MTTPTDLTCHEVLRTLRDQVATHVALLGEPAVASDARRGTRVGAGARWQDVLEAATPHGMAPLCGSAPGVGVVGYLTGGEGGLLRATPDENAELFWGLRGGKATLGIVTAVEIDLLPITQF